LSLCVLAAGVVQRWQGPVGVLRPGGRFEPLPGDTPLYVASKGMRQLAQHMADEVRCLEASSSSSSAGTAHGKRGATQQKHRMPNERLNKACK
jgi:hypothetical protein